MSNKQTRSKKKILEQLNNIPVIGVALQKAGVPKATYYRWVASDSDFKQATEEAIDQGRLCINDLAESKIIQKINDGEWKAMSYWLENNDKKYYKPRKPIIYSTREDRRTDFVEIIRTDLKNEDKKDEPEVMVF